MSREFSRQRRLRLIQTLVLLGIIVYLAVRAAQIIVGPSGAWITLALIAGISLFSLGNQRLTLPAGSRKLSEQEAPAFFTELRELAERANIESVPTVYVIPSANPEALTTGIGSNTLMIVSTGLLQILGRRELRAVMAHELSHVRNHDLTLFALVAAMQQVTRIVAGVIMAIVVVGLPMLLLGRLVLPVEAILYLGFVPLVSLFAQLALLRTREFQADLGAAELTGDPEALAAALSRIEHTRQPLWNSFIRNGTQQSKMSDLLKTHPTTEERIERLRSLSS
jgi:heat shock protein HtpX